MRSLLICIFSMFLISCGIGNYKGTNAGYLVMGIGFSKDTPSSTTFKINKLNTSNNYLNDFYFGYCKNTFWTGSCKPDYEDQAEFGIVSAAKLEPGDYIIGWFETQYGNISLKNKEYLGIRFTIKPNQITYIGNYQTNIATSKTLWWKSPNRVVFYLTDRKEQDIGYAKLNFPEIPTQNAISELPDLNTVSGKVYFTAEKPPTSK